MKTKKLKKITCMAICACMLSSANTLNIFAESPVFNITVPSIAKTSSYVVSNGIVYNFISEPGSVSLGEVSVGNNQSTNIENIVIPNSIKIKGKHYAVTKIEDAAFSSNATVKTISFGKSVKNVNASAFLNCPSLKEISVASDSPYFSSDNGILYKNSRKKLVKFPEANENTSFVINENTTEIDDFAFYGSQFLKTVTFPQNLFKVGNYAFSDCLALENVSMNVNTLEIGDYAFYKSGLKTINLAPTITTIGKAAFAFSDVARINLPTSLTDIQEGTFYNCESLSEITFGASTTTIGDYAFTNIKASKIEFPTNLKEIKSYAFAECKNLKSLSLNSFLSKIGDNAFYNCTAVRTVDIPKSLTTMGKDVFTGCSSLETFTSISGTPQEFSTENGILYNKNMTTLIHYPAANISSKYVLPSSLSKIEENALADAKYINEFELQSTENHFYIEDGILYDYHMTKLIKYPLGKGGSNFTVPDTVKEIENGAFKNSDISGIVNLPSELKTIGDFAFEGCSNITAFNINGTNLSVENGILYNSDKTELIQFPAGNKMTDFELPETVKSIKAGSFSNVKLNSIKLNSGLEKINDYAFANTKIQEIELPETLKEIGDYVFENTAISKIIFPSSIEKIGDYSFKNCKNLKMVKFNAQTPPTVESNAFLGCTELSEFSVPSKTSINSYMPMFLTLNIDNIDSYIKA